MKAEIKKCSRCGKSFECGAESKKCWCMDLPVAGEIPSQYTDCLCKECLKALNQKSSGDLSEGEDFYFENGLMVFTSAYHLKRGSCCNSGCRHCPYK